MTDRSTNLWAVPPRDKREPGVLYQHPTYSHAFYERLHAIQVSGIRFYREDFEVVFEVNAGMITGVSVDGLRFVRPPERDHDSEVVE